MAAVAESRQERRPILENGRGNQKEPDSTSCCPPGTPPVPYKDRDKFEQASWNSIVLFTAQPCIFLFMLELSLIWLVADAFAIHIWLKYHDESCDRQYALWCGVWGVMHFIAVLLGLAPLLIASSREQGRCMDNATSWWALAMQVISFGMMATLFVWVILGSVWVYPSWDTESHSSTLSCPKLLYMFTFGIVTAAWVYYLVLALLLLAAWFCGANKARYPNTLCLNLA